MSIKINGSERSLLDIQLKVLKSSKEALLKISEENPVKPVKYIEYLKPSRIDQGKGQLTLLDGNKNAFLCFLEKRTLWVPAECKLNPKKEYSLRDGSNSLVIKGSEMRKRGNIRFFVNPQKNPSTHQVSRNIEGVIKKFLEQVVENPSQQKPLSTTPDCKNGIKLEQAGFLGKDVFWFKPEMPELVKPEMYLAFNLYEVQKQIDATENWRKRPPVYAKQLTNYFDTIQTTGEFLRESQCLSCSISEKDWHILTDQKREGVKEQRAFVLKALNTPDVALLEGPPGSGKTTVILELILQLLKRGKRVLLSSATHVAIDNVLERIHKEQKEKNSNMGVLAIRISNNENSMSKVVKEHFHDKRIIYKAMKEMEGLLTSLSNKTGGQAMLLNSEGKADEKEFKHFLLNNANLVAGTLVGLLQHEGLKDRQPDFKPFDYLIVDEASKVTLSGFLVPAMWASRWVLVGDTKQLAPYSDGALVETILVKEQNLKIEEAEKLVQLTSDSFAYRQHEFEGKKKAEEFKLELTKFSKLQKEELFWLAQTFFPSVFELFQEGLPSWLQTEDSAFGLFNGIPNVLLKTEKPLWGQMLIEGEGTHILPWTNRFQSLSYQHRMVKELANVPHTHFYNGKNMYTSEKAESQEPKMMNLLGVSDVNACSWIQISENGSSQGGNHEEYQKVLKCLDEIETAISNDCQVSKVQIAIITFYRSQERTLKREFDRRAKVNRVEIQIKTVDSVQGQEADIVLLCFTTWGPNRFYNVPNRLNVAITRAKKRLFLFGNPEAINGYTNSPALQALCKNFNIQNIQNIQL